MPLLDYDRERVSAELRDGGETAEIAERLAAWQPSDDATDSAGLAILYHLIEAVGEFLLWRVDLDDVAVVVLAQFSCDSDGRLIYDGELTLSMMINSGFEVADTGIRSLAELTDFTADQDRAQRVLALLDAVTVRLEVVLADAMRFSRALTAHQRRAALRTPVPRPVAADGHVPTVEEIAAQIRREIAYGSGAASSAATATSAAMTGAVPVSPSAEQLITAREQALGRGRDSFLPQVHERNRGWRNEGCPAVVIESITPGGGGTHDTEVLLSNGLRLLAHEAGVLVADTAGRYLHFLDSVSPGADHDHLDLGLRF
ncbi:hypothetical protein [Nocardia sp. NPDC050710]|uniref:hypothetical protein n=1 Tax=Nocardia sp. NPDC050710 TaxID=3157220 RepID=UPI0033EE2AED